MHNIIVIISILIPSRTVGSGAIDLWVVTVVVPEPRRSHGLFKEGLKIEIPC